MIIREYRCRDCGTQFESPRPDPECPGCARASADREFRTPISIGSERSRGIDTTLQTLADDYGMANIANRDGAPAASAAASPFASRWISPGEGAGYMAQSGGDALSAVQGSMRPLPVSDGASVLAHLPAGKS